MVKVKIDFDNMKPQEVLALAKQCLGKYNDLGRSQYKIVYKNR